MTLALIDNTVSYLKKDQEKKKDEYFISLADAFRWAYKSIAAFNIFFYIEVKILKNETSHIIMNFS